MKPEKQTGIMFKPENIGKLPWKGGDGSKTQTRRIIKTKPYGNFVDIKTDLGYPASKGKLWAGFGNPLDPSYIKSPYGEPGDLLYLKEKLWDSRRGVATYASDGLPVMVNGESLDWRWSRNTLSPMFMPKKAARIWFEIVSVRVERIQDITEEDARAEGMEPLPSHGAWCDPAKGREGHWSYRRALSAKWNEINGKRGYAWDDNPWVWVLTFKQAERPGSE